MGNLKVVKDFLPSPDKLVLKKDKIKSITRKGNKK